jgi:hypothetical protein
VRILLDECVNPRIRVAFPGDEVTTVTEAGWSGMEDGALLRLACGKFDVFLTIDRGIEHQQNIAALDFGVVIVHVARNRMSHYQALLEQMRKAAATVRRGEVIHVSSKRQT